jgi:hypothetical protein
MYSVGMELAVYGAHTRLHSHELCGTNRAIQ